MARGIGQMQHQIHLLFRPRHGRCFKGDPHLVFHRRHRNPSGRGDGGRFALVERRRGAGCGPGQAAAHQQHMHRQLGHLWLADRHQDAAETVLHVHPFVMERPFRLLDHHQRAGGLERALDQQGRRLAGRILLFVRRQRHGLRRRLRPGNGRITGHETIDPHRLRAAGIIGGRQFNDIDACFRRIEMQFRRVCAADDMPLFLGFVDHLRIVFRRPSREIARLQHGIPVPVDEPHGHFQPGERLAFAIQRQHFRLDGAGVRNIARQFHAQHERRQRHHVLHAAHLHVVIAGNGGFHHIFARLRRRLDGWIQHQLCRPAHIGFHIARQHRRGAETDIAGKPAIGGELEPLPSWR